MLLFSTIIDNPNLAMCKPTQIMSPTVRVTLTIFQARARCPMCAGTLTRVTKTTWNRVVANKGEELDDDIYAREGSTL